jgi:agmatinase
VQVAIRDLSEDEHAMIAGSGGASRPSSIATSPSARSKASPSRRPSPRSSSELPEHVYISFDIDGLDPSLCPHTGTPVPGGLSYREAVALIAAVKKSGRTLVGFDLNEVAPGPDGDEWDANVGARLLYKLIGFALTSRS